MRTKNLPLHSVQITKAREAAGLTRYAAAKRAGLTQHAYTSVELGSDAKLSTLRQIAEALSVPLRDLVDPLPERVVGK